MKTDFKIPELNKSQLITIGIAAAVVIAIIIVIAVKWQQLKAWIQTKQYEKTIDEQITKSELTLTTAQAQGIADKMYAAMNGAGTDEEVLYSAFESIETYSDLMLVIKCFGNRKGSWSWFRSESSLMQWIADDCSAKEIARINAILTSKNINFTF